MNELKIKNLLGLAQRARKLVSGNFQVIESLKKSDEVKLLIVTEDASDRTLEDFKKISDEKKIPLIQILTKESLGQCLGKDFRATAAVLDEGFTKSIEKLLSSAKE